MDEVKKGSLKLSSPVLLILPVLTLKDQPTLPRYIPLPAQSKNATAYGSGEFKHTYTYTKDCGKALKLLAETRERLNQVWHLAHRLNQADISRDTRSERGKTRNNCQIHTVNKVLIEYLVL